VIESGSVVDGGAIDQPVPRAIVRRRPPASAAGWTPIAPSVTPMTDNFMDILRFLRPLW
jgi:hypothetical protein